MKASRSKVVSVSKEAWHIEAEVFEKEVHRLMELARRDLIDSEEFMQKMLQFHPTPKAGEYPVLLLNQSEDGDLQMTAEWAKAHKGWVERAKELVDRLVVGDLKEAIERSSYPLRLRNTLGIALNFIAYSEFNGGMQVTYFPAGGFPNFSTHPPPPAKTEAEFDRRVVDVLSSADKLVSELEASRSDGGNP